MLAMLKSGLPLTGLFHPWAGWDRGLELGKASLSLRRLDFVFATPPLQKTLSEGLQVSSLTSEKPRGWIPKHSPRAPKKSLYRVSGAPLPKSLHGDFQNPIRKVLMLPWSPQKIS